MKQASQQPAPLGGSKGPKNRKALVAKAGKRRAPLQSPPHPHGERRAQIARKAAQYIEDHPGKSYTPHIRESVESLVPGKPPIKLAVVPGTVRWDLMRAQRLTFETAKGNQSGA